MSKLLAAAITASTMIVQAMPPRRELEEVHAVFIALRGGGARDRARASAR